MNNSSQTPRSVVAAQALFFVNAAIWVVLGLYSLLRLASGETDQTVTFFLVAILMFGNAGAMLVAGLGIGKQTRLFYYLGLAVLVVNLILTVTDEFGLLDLITLVIDAVLFGLLIVTRARYLSAR